MEAYWLNVGSLIFGLMAWGIPVIGMIQYRKGDLRRKVIFSVVSLGACAISLCMQIFYTDYLVKIADWTALMDISSAVAKVSFILLMVTLILNGISLVLGYREQ